MKNYKLYEVGGCVRDRLLGLESKDIDYSFEFTSEIRENMSDMSPRIHYNVMNSMLKEEGFEIFLETPDCFTTRAKFPCDTLQNLLLIFHGDDL